MMFCSKRKHTGDFSRNPFPGHSCARSWRRHDGATAVWLRAGLFHRYW